VPFPTAGDEQGVTDQLWERAWVEHGRVGAITEPDAADLGRALALIMVNDTSQICCQFGTPELLAENERNSLWYLPQIPGGQILRYAKLKQPFASSHDNDAVDPLSASNTSWRSAESPDVPTVWN
jgi:hypothetical protein